MIDLRVPVPPDCWDSCGACAAGDTRVAEVLVNVGDRVRRDETLMLIETDKTTLEIAAPGAGQVARIHVAPGDTVVAGDLLLALAE